MNPRPHPQPENRGVTALLACFVLVLCVPRSPLHSKDTQLQRDLRSTARAVGLPEKPDLLRKELDKRMEHHRDALAKQWQKETKEYLKALPAREINLKDTAERKALAMYKANGSWRYSYGVLGGGEKALPTTREGISECWMKHSLSKTYNLGTQISTVAGQPSKHYYSHGQEIRWRKCSWDAKRSCWALVTLTQREKVVKDYAKHLREEMLSLAGQTAPDESQLEKARSYAKRASAASTDTKKKKEQRQFREKSDVSMGYFRLVFAYDKAIRFRCIQEHLGRFQEIPWGK